MSQGSVREFVESDEPDVTAIVQRVWGKNTLSKFVQLHAWFRKRSTALATKGANDVVVEQDGRVVGYSRVLPCMYQVNGRRLLASYFIDSVTDPDYRGSGISMFRHLLSDPEILRLGTPVTRLGNFLNKLVRKNCDIFPIARCVLVLRPSVFTERVHAPRFIGIILDAAWKTRLKFSFFLASRNKPGANLEISDEETLPGSDEMDALFSDFSRGYHGIAVRDNAYLQWRFLECPYTYRYLWLSSGGRLEAYAIYRRATFNGRPTMLIVEIIATGNQRLNYLTMLKYIYNQANAESCVDIQTLKSGCLELGRVLRQLGAVLKFEKQNFMAYVRPDNAYADLLHTNKNWFISLAESDYEFAMYK